MAHFMQFSGGRELVDEAKAEELLKSFSVGDDVTHIKLSNKSFDNAAAHKVAQYLESLTSITHADISDIIAGRPEDEALRTVRIISEGLKKFGLVELNVSDNAFGGKGIEACRDILIGQKLERLYLCNNGLSAEACVRVAEILLRSGSPPPLKLLHFYNNMSGSGGATAAGEILTMCPAMEDFRFSATRSGPEGCLAIANAVGSVATLKRVDLSDNNFGADATEVLADNLRRQKGLEYLNLRDDGLTEEGVKFVLEALEHAKFAHLTHLDLAGNEITEDLAGDLASTLKALPAVSHVFLDDNELTSEGAKALAKQLKGVPSLKTLSVTSCEITASGAVALARAVAALPGFVNLELNGNQITEAGVAKVKEILSKAGKILGEMDDNDEDGDDDLEEEDEEEADEAVDDLAENLQKGAAL